MDNKMCTYLICALALSATLFDIIDQIPSKRLIVEVEGKFVEEIEVAKIIPNSHIHKLNPTSAATKSQAQQSLVLTPLMHMWYL